MSGRDAIHPASRPSYPALAAPSPASAARASWPAALGRLLAHLRLPFQLLLAPIFMLGALLGGAALDATLLVAFVAVHAGIYGGMTAFNGYHDRDQGPIAFMKHPPRAGRFVRDAALVLQAVAVLLLLDLCPLSAVPAALLVLMGVAYSHPRWRWKASLWKSLAAVAGGQGVLAFAIGLWLASPEPRAIIAGPPLLGAAAAALTVLGLYPITQLYQIDEDRRRGDRSLAVVIGWRRALLVAGASFGAGVGLLALALRERLGGVALCVLLAGAPLLWLALLVWSRRFERQDVYRNHDWALGLSAAAAAGFWLLLIGSWLAGVPAAAAR